MKYSSIIFRQSDFLQFSIRTVSYVQRNLFYVRLPRPSSFWLPFGFPLNYRRYPCTSAMSHPLVFSLLDCRPHWRFFPFIFRYTFSVCPRYFQYPSPAKRISKSFIFLPSAFVIVRYSASYHGTIPTSVLINFDIHYICRWSFSLKKKKKPPARLVLFYND